MFRLIALIALFQVFCSCVHTERSFGIDYDHDTFVKDGQPFRYVSGSIHYFRVPRELWADRLTKLRAAGFNALETYIEWSSHEETPGVFNVTDIVDYVKAAQAADLLVILRPGPFIDAERDFGGFPWWLLQQNENMKLRSVDETFKFFVKRWYDVVLPALRPYLYVNGGPIIMVQVENEYGAFGCDKNYTTWLRDVTRDALVDNVLLFTTDGNTADNDYATACGKIDGVYATVDFGVGTDPMTAFAVQRRVEPKGPRVNSEFYPGWLDHWGTPHQTQPTEAVANALDKMLSLNASVNMYMFHGGTSFGYKAGSNDGQAPNNNFLPCPTSYDYDAPLSEAGDPTEKYYAIQQVISKYLPLPTGPKPVAQPKATYGPVQMFQIASFGEILEKFAKNHTSQYPMTFEQLGTGEAYVFYSTHVTEQPADPALLSVPGLHDRAQVYVNGHFKGTLSRTQNVYSMPLSVRKGDSIGLLVENQGRLCFGLNIAELKGIVGNVTLGSAAGFGQKVLENWVHAFNMDQHMNHFFANSRLEQVFEKMLLSNQEYKVSSPASYFGYFTVIGDPQDTFLRVDGWGKGVAFVNGFNLGRYWPEEGPQVTLYVPRTVLLSGINMVAVFETERAPCGTLDSHCTVSLVNEHVVNGTVPFRNS